MDWPCQVSFERFGCSVQIELHILKRKEPSRRSNCILVKLLSKFTYENLSVLKKCHRFVYDGVRFMQHSRLAHSLCQPSSSIRVVRALAWLPINFDNVCELIFSHQVHVYHSDESRSFKPHKWLPTNRELYIADEVINQVNSK